MMSGNRHEDAGTRMNDARRWTRFGSLSSAGPLAGSACPASRQTPHGKTWWSDSNIFIPSRRSLLRMLESKDHWQILNSSGALDLTFALRALGWAGSECQSAPLAFSASSSCSRFAGSPSRHHTHSVSDETSPPLRRSLGSLPLLVLGRAEQQLVEASQQALPPHASSSSFVSPFIEGP